MTKQNQKTVEITIETTEAQVAIFMRAAQKDGCTFEEFLGKALSGNG